MDAIGEIIHKGFDRLTAYYAQQYKERKDVMKGLIIRSYAIRETLYTTYCNCVKDGSLQPIDKADIKFRDQVKQECRGYDTDTRVKYCCAVYLLENI